VVSRWAGSVGTAVFRRFGPWLLAPVEVRPQDRGVPSSRRTYVVLAQGTERGSCLVDLIGETSCAVW
jgi:hypothetical protein